MLDSENGDTKCHDNIHDNMITHYDIGLPISMFIIFADASAKLGRK